MQSQQGDSTQVSSGPAEARDERCGRHHGGVCADAKVDARADVIWISTGSLGRPRAEHATRSQAVLLAALCSAFGRCEADGLSSAL